MQQAGESIQRNVEWPGVTADPQSMRRSLVSALPRLMVELRLLFYPKQGRQYPVERTRLV